MTIHFLGEKNRNMNSERAGTSQVLTEQSVVPVDS